MTVRYHLWRSRWAAIGAAIAVTIGGGGLIAVSAASSPPSSSHHRRPGPRARHPNRHRPHRTLPITAARIRRRPPPITVGSNPYGVAFDGTNIWVSNSSTGTVSKMVPF